VFIHQMSLGSYFDNLSYNVQRRL